MKYDLTVFGGGTAGVAAAYIGAKYGLETLLVEKSDVLGGTITQGLVMPCMKLDTGNINTEFSTDLKKFADKYNARHKYIDNNEFWFNPELLKIVFDDMLSSVKATVLFNSAASNTAYDNDNSVFNVKIDSQILSLYVDTKYIIDSTSNSNIFKLLNCEFQNNSEQNQAPTLRFMVSGVDLKKFSTWLEKTDKDRNVTTVEHSAKGIHLSTAYTWDTGRKWALKPIFDNAIKAKDIEYEDSAYFQLFTVPNMPNTVNLNAPRIILTDDEDIKDPFVYSRALKQGRERIYRLYNFCKKYLPGFQNSYISHISDMLGVRESYRVKCKYTLTKDDIINVKQFENIAICSNYPVDIHSNKNNNDKLEFTKHTYNIPIDALISSDYDQLYVAGKNISADFDAQAAVRTQLNCFSMGEAAAKDIAVKIKSDLLAG